MAPRLSLVVPAYNEMDRLPAFLVTLRSYLSNKFFDSYEVVVVDDGSQDQTAATTINHATDWPQLSLIRHATNIGKGQAIRTGVAAARGDFILIADADGATPIAEEGKLGRVFEQDADIVIGSRLLEPECIQRSWGRGLSGRLFARLARRVLDIPVMDPQCGFKMFRREVGQRLFAMCRQTGYLIDLEFLLHARRLGYAVAEMPVTWRDMPGSKVRLFRDGCRMVRGLWKLRREFAKYRSDRPFRLASSAIGEPVHLLGYTDRQSWHSTTKATTLT